MEELYPVIILAGGLATRLRPLTETIPKSLVSVNGEPFIHHQLRLLHRQGISQVVLCLGYLGEMVEDVIGNGHQFGLKVQYSYDGPKLLGTAGAIKKALESVDITPVKACLTREGEDPSLIIYSGNAEHGSPASRGGHHGLEKNQRADIFFVLYGDSYLTCDYAAVQKTFLASKKQGLMTVFHNQNQWDTSNVEYQHGYILDYSKRNRTDRMHHIDYGLGMFHYSAFDHIDPTREHDLSAIQERLLKKNQLAGAEVCDRFYEIGSFAGINELESFLSEENRHSFLTESHSGYIAGTNEL